MALSEAVFTDVTTVNDDDNTNVCEDTNVHVFNYSLNDKKTRKKIYDGANRVPYKREEKKGCTNLMMELSMK